MTMTVFKRSPDGGKGLARDTRARCVLEEVGQAGFRRSIGGIPRQATGRSIEVSPGSKSASEFFIQFMGPDFRIYDQ